MGLVARAAVLSHSCGGREAGTLGVAWSGSGESTLPSFYMAIFLVCPCTGRVQGEGASLVMSLWKALVPLMQLWPDLLSRDLTSSYPHTRSRDLNTSFVGTQSSVYNMDCGVAGW